MYVIDRDDIDVLRRLLRGRRCGRLGRGRGGRAAVLLGGIQCLEVRWRREHRLALTRVSLFGNASGNDIRIRVRPPRLR